ncbi:hypothetical protein GCM10010300_34360 [Streptomyces olivaceoviridis]|uniref:hypothetical protein n=1 Tax=Streptomyces olivaceoviridis TaxID=1921 RepID=UPI0019946168|nr:hypothetical protein GCM10010300_34360 [Streptomyces olivaceoviridis]
MTQLCLGCGLGVLAVVRRHWPAVLLLGVGARIVLDPGVHDYYTAGLLLGTPCWERLGLQCPVPAWSLTASPRGPKQLQGTTMTQMFAFVLRQIEEQGFAMARLEDYIRAPSR